MLTYMDAAIAAAEKGRDVFHQGPLVGAVLSGPAIISIAYRGEFGREMHAEEAILQRESRDEDMRNSALYVTMEPCDRRIDTWRKSCVDLIIECRIKSVYVGLLNPDLAHQGHGIRKLRAAGIQVHFFPAIYQSRLDNLLLQRD